MQFFSSVQDFRWQIAFSEISMFQCHFTIVEGHEGWGGFKFTMSQDISYRSLPNFGSILESIRNNGEFLENFKRWKFQNEF